MDNLDYTIIETNKESDIKHNDYILYDGEAYKIHFIRYGRCGKIRTHVTYKCHDFMETKNEFIRFSLDENFCDYIKFKQSVSKIIFTIQNATFVDYNNNTLSMLDEEGNVVDIKYNNYKQNEDENIKYIKFGENYKII